VQVFDGVAAKFTQVDEDRPLPVAVTGRDHPHVVPQIVATLAAE
jgi:carbonic anhydrase